MVSEALKDTNTGFCSKKLNWKWSFTMVSCFLASWFLLLISITPQFFYF